MYSQNKKRLTVKKTAEANERGKRAKSEDAALRRPLSASSLGRERVGVLSPTVDPAPAQRYTQDREAYKRRKSPVSDVIKIIKAGKPIDGHRIR